MALSAGEAKPGCADKGVPMVSTRWLQQSGLQRKLLEEYTKPQGPPQSLVYFCDDQHEGQHWQTEERTPLWADFLSNLH